MRDLREFTKDELDKEITRITAAIQKSKSDNFRIDNIKYLSRLGRELERRRRYW